MPSSPQQYLHAFLRSLDADAEGLPDRFVASLERALARYGITSLERTPALEAAGYRLFLSRQRARDGEQRGAGDPRAPPGAAPLGRPDEDCAGLRDLLDRLEAALAASEPGLAELARRGSLALL